MGEKSHQSFGNHRQTDNFVGTSNNSNPIFMKTTVRFGLILAGTLIGLSLLFFGLALDKNETVQSISSILNILINAVIVFIGIRAERETTGNGFISFGKGFSTGMMITLIGSAITGVYTYLYFAFLNPGMITFIRMKQEEEMLKRGMSDEAVEKMADNMHAWTTPELMTLFAFLGMILIGLVISMICAAILKKENPAEQIS
jgi:hypothetical protein